MSNVKPKVNDNANWKVNKIHRLTACENRQGHGRSGKMLTVIVLDDEGKPLQGVVVNFDTEPSEGTAYDHPNVWGITNEHGYVAWNHLGISTRYMIWMGDDEEPLIENIRTDLGKEYCRPPGRLYGGWRPVNRPGVYSYRIEIQRKGKGDAPGGTGHNPWG